jgi:hypothetical protein
MKKLKRSAALIAALAVSLSGTVIAGAAEKTDETKIQLSDKGITVDGKAAQEDDSSAVYVSNDIVYYEDRDTYESGNLYGEGTDKDKHTSAEADAHTVVNITQSGTYRISGTLSQGQIAVDLGDDAKGDPESTVTIILDGADITCTVAPAVIFYNVYECDEAWYSYDEGESESYEPSETQDTTDAGAKVIIADGSVNNINGSYVARIYKDSAEQKKKHKYDGAFYSKMSMTIDGEKDDSGVLNITAENEGLNSELHLTINGGKINIAAGNDGINTNEDDVSVTTINGGALHIVAGLGEEGDGIDSNGYLVINGGTVISTANPRSDSGLDSDMGSFINGGCVVATGSTMDWPESNSNQVTMNLQFAASQADDEAIIVTDTDGKVIFAYDPDKDETTGSYNRGYQGAVISSPQFKTGETYNVYVGGDVEGTETDGLYDVSTVTAFTDAVQQEYTGNDVGRRGGSMMGGRSPFGETDGITDDGNGNITITAEAAQKLAESIKAFDPSSAVTAEEIAKCTTMDSLMQLMGKNKGDRPENMGERPEDMGDRPDNMKMPPNGEAPGEMPPMGGKMPENNIESTAMPASDRFYMNDKVNSFSGVSDKGTSEAMPFGDIEEGDWFYNSVRYVYGNNIFTGISQTEFSPNTSLSRAMLWTALAKLSDEDVAGTQPWYAKAQAWAKAEGISDGTNADENVTREQLVSMLYRLAGSPESTGSLEGFKDADKVSSYAKTAVKWAVEKGIISGNDKNELNPQSGATRAEAAAFVERYMKI